MCRKILNNTEAVPESKEESLLSLSYQNDNAKFSLSRKPRSLQGNTKNKDNELVLFVGNWSILFTSSCPCLRETTICLDRERLNVSRIIKNLD